MGRGALLGGVAALAVLALGGSGAAGSTALRAPLPLQPKAGAVFPEPPALGWRPVAGAERYEVQVAADPQFSSLRNQRLVTRNTLATLTQAVPDGTYWWRVRAVSRDGQVSGWSRPRSLRKAWTEAPRLVSPVGGARVRFPTTPLTLVWSPVARAAKYRVSIATDESLASLVGGRSVETAGTSYAPSLALSASEQGKRYYWAVTPVDARGNRGPRTRVASFVWVWPSRTTVELADLREEPETFDPQLSWAPVPGAVRYEVEINPSQDFAPGSRVCCREPVIGTSLSPTRVFKDNTYFWRVRAIDGDGNVGVWNPERTEQNRFEKVFDRAAKLGHPSIQNLRMRDNLNDPAPSGPTQAPIVVWDPVPGASSYFVEVAPFRSSACDWTAGPSEHWRVETAVTAWTPLGQTLAPKPYPDERLLSTDALPRLSAGASYCVRVRARTDRDERGADVYGDFTYLNGSERAAFTFGGYPCSSGCTRAYVPADGYLSPREAKVATTPYFTWRASGAAGWWVIVAKDPDFHTIVDYAYTRVPAYAPRERERPLTYSDETTLYYWALLPAPNPNGTGAPGDPLSANAASFQKQSAPPRLLGPAAQATLGAPPVFRWTPVLGARRYRLQVARDDDFGSLVEDVTTVSIAYTSNASYPADVALHWRVRAEDETGVGLTWSERRTFRYRLPAPRLVRGAASGEGIPTWRWQPVVGAVSYDVHAELPDGSDRDVAGLRSAALTAIRMTGTGVFRWRVRASFPKAGYGTVPGPYSAPARFTRTIGPVEGARTVGGGRAVLLTWQPKPLVKEYVVELSDRPDFGSTIARVRTDLTTWAPPLDSDRYTGVVYWRVAAVDEDGNQGGFARPQTARLPPKQERRALLRAGLPAGGVR